MYRNRADFLVIVGVLAIIYPAKIWAYDGAGLLQDCKLAMKQYETPAKKAEIASDEAVAAERCRSFLWGSFTVLRSVQINKDTRLACVPATVKHEQVVRIVTKWLGDNPSRLHLPAEYATVISLREAFPCPKKNRAPNNVPF